MNYEFDDEGGFKELREFLAKIKSGELKSDDWAVRMDNDCLRIEPKEQPDGTWDEKEEEWDEWGAKIVDLHHTPAWVLAWMFNELGFAVSGV